MKIGLSGAGVFWTIQGEGALCGEPMVFIRTAGCSVGCVQCDTNYTLREKAPVVDVVSRCEVAREKNVRAEYAFVTGGEPTDHGEALDDLRYRLWRAGFKPCLATSGVRAVTSPWWMVSVSPHSPDFVQRSGYELKLVPGLNGLRLEDVSLDGLSFGNCFVQPLHGDRESLESCLRWIKTHRHFRMSPQNHKSWGMQ